MPANQADCVAETVIAMGAFKHRPPYQLHDQRVCKRCGGASVRVAALSRSIDSPRTRSSSVSIVNPFMDQWG